MKPFSFSLQKPHIFPLSELTANNRRAVSTANKKKKKKKKMGEMVRKTWEQNGGAKRGGRVVWEGGLKL